MTAEVETMAYAGEIPWHGLGVKVSQEAQRDYKRMLVEAGLEWEVNLVPLVTIDSHETVERFATRRSSDGRILGTVGPRYRILQNLDAFKWFEPFLEAGEAELHTAGSLFSGARVWVLAKISRDPLEIRPNDFVEKFLLLSNGHDGLLSIRVGFTPIRVVCNNTLQMAHGHQNSQLIRIRHTSSAQTNLEAVRETVNIINQQFEATGEQYRRLAHKDINQQDVLNYVKLVFDLPAEDQNFTKAQAKLVVELVDDIYKGIGNTGETLWDAYNGVTQYLSHQKGRTQEKRLDNLWFGDSQKLNQKALNLALEIAA